jgi:iron complex transport system substrate-binding protein
MTAFSLSIPGSHFMLVRSAAIRISSPLWFALLLVFIGIVSPASAGRTVTDMAGRAVEVPDKIERVATIGPVPVLNSFVFAMGEAASLANNLPPNLGGPRWRFQYVVAPDIAHRPIIQTGQGPNVEGVIEAAPDVVLTMDLTTVDLLKRTHVPTLYLSWQKPDDVKAVMRLLGLLYGKQSAAESYVSFFDKTMAFVGSRVDALPNDQRPRVLYANLRSMTQPHKIAEWWIAKAGGRSVTDDGRTGEAFNFSVEQILAWNPEVIVVTSEPEIANAYADSRLAQVSAIKNKRVYAIPMGVHVWGNRTVEQPLTVLWAAKVFHPALFADVAMGDEIRNFYSAFFKVALGPDDIDMILAGRAGSVR